MEYCYVKGVGVFCIVVGKINVILFGDVFNDMGSDFDVVLD